jgi:transcriptional regulator with XRE-family HTH domain
MSNVATLPSPTFSDLLRAWRKNRRVSQETLAGSAEISQRHLSFLESGRSSPSRLMVQRLADALDIPLRETNSLLNAAGYANVYTRHQLDDDEMREARQALAIMLKHHEPYGAIVVDRNWNLLMMNDANVRLFSQFVDPMALWDAVGGETPNMMRATLHENGLRSYVDNHEDFVRFFINHLERELTDNPYNNEARELLNELLSYPGVADVERLSPAPSVPFQPLSLSKGDVHLNFFTMVTTFGTPLDVTLQEIRIETFFPADPTTETYMRNLSPD